MTSTGTTNGAEETAGTEPEYVAAHTDDEGVVITTSEPAGDGN